jgi:DNA repair exonuclease SbcCD ATPase subunit
LSTSNELDQLQIKRKELEEKSRSLEEQQKNLEERAKMLEEKIAIEQLEDNVQMKHNAVEELESKIGELERKLKRPPSETEPFTPKEEPASENIQEEQEGPTEDYVEVTTVGDTADEDSLKQQHEKKKRKIF